MFFEGSVNVLLVFWALRLKLSFSFCSLSLLSWCSGCSLGVLSELSECSLRNDKKWQVSKTGSEINLNYRRLHRTQCASQSCRLVGTKTSQTEEKLLKKKHLNHAGWYKNKNKNKESKNVLIEQVGTNR